MPTGNATLKLLDPFAGYFCARRTKSTQDAVYKSSSYSTPAFVPDKKLQSQPSKYGHAQKVIKVFSLPPRLLPFIFTPHCFYHFPFLVCFFSAGNIPGFTFLRKGFPETMGNPKLFWRKNTLVVADRTKLRFFRFVLFCYFFSFVFLSRLFDWIMLILGCLVLKDRFPL